MESSAIKTGGLCMKVGMTGFDHGVRFQEKEDHKS